MELILWRHADAEEGEDDLARRLTAKGEGQACKMATWLKPHLSPSVRILVSPAVRAQQTAHALNLPFETVESIAPSATPQALLDAAGWPHAGGCVLLVGHQPCLGQVAARLLATDVETLSVKKGSIWWFEQRVREQQTQVVLRGSMLPAWLTMSQSNLS